MAGENAPEPEVDQPARLHLILRGFVQGVGFRYFALEAAQHLGLTGWVRNNRDGSVEALAEGRRRRLEHWLDAMRRGPTGARVTNVEVAWGAATNEYGRFIVRHD